MKQQYPLRIFFLLLLSLLLLSSFSASARLLLPTQGEKEVTENDMAQILTTAESKYETERMGSEECGEEDEECYKRRMIEEAHLDYIYTQHHRPSYKHEP